MPRMITAVLTAALIFNASAAELSAQPPAYHPVVVEDNYSQSDTYRIAQGLKGYEKITPYGNERFRQLMPSTKEILKLPVFLGVYEVYGGFVLPSEVSGIVMDIPFNYYSSLEASAEYFQMLLFNGWEIVFYNASSLCVQIGLVQDGVTCRLLIYKDYLKVYCSLI